MPNSVLTQTDTDVLEVLLAHVAIERKHPRPIYEQLRTAIELAIFSGEIPDREFLPSIRRLADVLGIAPNTVVHAYRDLERDGWIRPSPKRGYLVTLGADDNEEPRNNARLEVSQRIDHALRAAQAANLNSSDFLRLVAERIREQQTAQRYVAVVGFREAFLEERVGMVAESIADLGVQVVGIAFQDRMEWISDGVPALDQIEWFLVPVGESQQAQEFLGEHASRILPMTRTLRDDVRDFIASQSPETVFGAIAGTQDHTGRIVAALRRFHPLRNPPLVASTTDPDKVERVMQDADVIVIGTRARPYFEQRGFPEKSFIELDYVPDQKTIRRLRERLASRAGR